MCFFFWKGKKGALVSQIWLNYFMDHQFGYVTKLTPKNPEKKEN